MTALHITTKKILYTILIMAFFGVISATATTPEAQGLDSGDFAEAETSSILERIVSSQQSIQGAYGSINSAQRNAVSSLAYGNFLNQIPGSARAITGFTIPSQVGGTIIDESNLTITITMPYGSNPNGLVPAIVTSGGALSPASGVSQDFSSPVIYTVTAENGQTRTYNVDVLIANDPPSAPTILNTTYVSGPSVLIRITPATDADGSVVSHSIYRDGSFLSTTSSSDNPIVVYDNTISAGATYTYTATATDDDSAESVVSNSSQITVPNDVTPPSDPTNFRITSPYNSGTCSITLAWDDSTDDTVAQEDLWYILSSPLDESYFYTWTQDNPYTLSPFCWDSGVHEVYLQATDGDNNSSKVGPIIITAP